MQITTTTSDQATAAAIAYRQATNLTGQPTAADVRQLAIDVLHGTGYEPVGADQDARDVEQKMATDLLAAAILAAGPGLATWLEKATGHSDETELANRDYYETDGGTEPPAGKIVRDPDPD